MGLGKEVMHEPLHVPLHVRTAQRIAEEIRMEMKTARVQRERRVNMAARWMERRQLSTELSAGHSSLPKEHKYYADEVPVAVPVAGFEGRALFSAAYNSSHSNNVPVAELIQAAGWDEPKDVNQDGVPDPGVRVSSTPPRGFFPPPESWYDTVIPEPKSLNSKRKSAKVNFGKFGKLSFTQKRKTEKKTEPVRVTRQYRPDVDVFNWIRTRDKIHFN